MKPHLIGFVIANDEEEFLTDVRESSSVVVKAWARHPDFALVFVTRLEARQMIFKLRQHCKLWALELWDFGSQLVVTTPEKIAPSWLHRHLAA
jgi:hypothetical protein